MKRSTRFAVMSTLLLASASAKAGEFELPNYNAYEDGRVVSAKPLAPGRFREVQLPGVTSQDVKRGIPTFFWAPKNGPVAPTAGSGRPEDSARFYLETYAPTVHDSGRAALASAKTRVVNDKGHGGIVVVFQQLVNGIELIRQEVKVTMTRNHELVAISGNLHNALSVGAKRGNTWKLTRQAAISRAVNDFFAIHSVASDFVDVKKSKDNYTYFDFAGTPESVAAHMNLSQATRIKKVWFPMPDRIVAAYYLELWGEHTVSGESALYSYIIGAADGKLLFRERRTHDAAHTYRVWADPMPPYNIPDGPVADFQPHPTGLPDGSAPPFVAPNLVTIDGFNTNPGGTFDPWLPAGATETLGNNVSAYVDWVTPNGIGGDFRADVTAPGIFDRTYDTSLAPDVSNDQAKAAITQLFFLNNWMHDYWYDSGFNETAGNAQTDNYGRGGAQGGRSPGRGPRHPRRVSK